MIFNARDFFFIVSAAALRLPAIVWTGLKKQLEADELILLAHFPFDISKIRVVGALELD